MNLRCIYCQTPFTLSRVEMLNGIIAMNEKHQNHYDAHCPRCRRANSISRQRMELFFPNWQAAAKELASAAPPVPPAPSETQTPAPKVEKPATAYVKTEPIPRITKEIGVKTPVEKAATSSPKERQPAAAPKTPAVKPAAKGKKPAAIASSKGKKPAGSSTTKKSAVKKPANKTAESKTKKK